MAVEPKNKKSPNWNPENHLNQTCMTLGSMLHPRRLTCPLKRWPFSVGNTSSNHRFSGGMLVFGGVIFPGVLLAGFIHFVYCGLDWCAPGIGLVVGTWLHILSFFHINKKGVRNASKRLWTLNIIPSLKGGTKKSGYHPKRFASNNSQISLEPWNLRFFCFKIQQKCQASMAKTRQKLPIPPKSVGEFVDTIQEVTYWNDWNGQIDEKSAAPGTLITLAIK